MLEITKNIEGTTMDVVLKGRIDTTSVTDFDREVRDALTGVNAVVIDMGGLEYLSSAGLRSLLTIHKAMKPKGGMTLTHVNDYVMEIFDFTGFDLAFNIV